MHTGSLEVVAVAATAAVEGGSGGGVRVTVAAAVAGEGGSGGGGVTLTVAEFSLESTMGVLVVFGEAADSGGFGGVVSEASFGSSSAVSDVIFGGSSAVGDFVPII